MILEALEREGVELIFGYPGGANLPIYQHLPEHPKLKHILVRHEQGAAHMADGYARACGKPGVVFATSGPGALNLSLIHISEPTRLGMISYAVFCLKQKKNKNKQTTHDYT